MATQADPGKPADQVPGPGDRAQHAPLPDFTDPLTAEIFRALQPAYQAAEARFLQRRAAAEQGTGTA